jgi:hypothetical protein
MDWEAMCPLLRSELVVVILSHVTSSVLSHQILERMCLVLHSLCVVTIILSCITKSYIVNVIVNSVPLTPKGQPCNSVLHTLGKI